MLQELENALFSEFVVLNSPLTDLSLELVINGKVAQRGGYDLMLSKPEQLLKDIGYFLTLEDGDLLMTGTPAGVGAIKRGDEFHATLLDAGSAIIEQSWIARA